MRILRLHGYYFPENTSDSHLDDDLEEGYAKNGIVSVNYAPTPTRGVTKQIRREYKKKKYEERRDGHIIIHRFSMFSEGKNPIMRALRYMLCNIKEYFKGIKEKDIDLVYCISTPPTQGMLSAMVAKKLSKKYKRHVPFVYNLQDIFPDSLVTTNLAKKGGILWKIGRKIENYTYKNADKIIVISESFKQNIMEKGVPEEKIEIVSNWIDDGAVSPISREKNPVFDEFGIDRNKFIVLYAGNFGASQGAEIVIDAAEHFRENSDIHFVIFGGGAGFDSAVERIKASSLENVTVNPYLPQERVGEVYSLGDVAIITCKNGVGNAGMPSKTWSIMACNTPIIASFDTDSELARIIEKAGAGVCVEPESVDALTEAIEDCFKNRENLKCTAREYIHKNSSKAVNVEKNIKIITAVAGKEK
ncbi:MAG: glycosyltransferase family 4 protein [Clostridia bacterium]|nr:glycosyltransferase family 4 protein [Clostridia bacterium]